MAVFAFCDHPGEVSPSQSSVAIDTLSATFPHPEKTPEAFVGNLVNELYLGIPLQLKKGSGHFGFREGYHLLTSFAGSNARLCSLYVGEKAQANRWMLYITSKGCGLVVDWLAAHSLLSTVLAKVTRVDLCMDFLNGEFTVDQAVVAYEGGMFDGRGRRPSCRQMGDWLYNKMGRTLYVGHASNGKQFRIYEKGKQLGQLDSPWVRAEVTFTAKGKSIPLDVLLHPERYFSGAYPVLAGLSDAAALAMPARQKEQAAELSRKLFHLRQAYGTTVSQALMTEGCTPNALVDVLAKPGRTGAANSASQGITWKEVKDELSNY